MAPSSANHLPRQAMCSLRQSRFSHVLAMGRHQRLSAPPARVCMSSPLHYSFFIRLREIPHGRDRNQVAKAAPFRVGLSVLTAECRRSVALQGPLPFSTLFGRHPGRIKCGRQPKRARSVTAPARYGRGQWGCQGENNVRQGKTRQRRANICLAVRQA
jgi:hypothetical protein